MNYLVLYSSRTGNTRMVARAIQKALPEGTPCVDIKDLKESLPEGTTSYDCVFMGYWVDKGTADEASRTILKSLDNPYIALFATLGADPKSPHAMKSLEQGAACLPDGKKPLGAFICQGKVDPKLIEAMYRMFPSDNIHGKNPKNEASHKAASTHPDEKDLSDAAHFAHEIQLMVEEGRK